MFDIGLRWRKRTGPGLLFEPYGKLLRNIQAETGSKMSSDNKKPSATRPTKVRSAPSRTPETDDPELDPGKILQSIDNEEIYLRMNGKRKLMKKAEFEFEEMFTQAIKGDLTAARLVATMLANYAGAEEEAPSETAFMVVPDEEMRAMYEAKRLQPGAGDRISEGKRQFKFKQGRFLKPQGESTNLVSAHYLFQKVASEKIAINVRGERVMMTRMEAYFRQVQVMACKDVRAARLLIRLRKQFPGPPVGGNKTIFVITEDDARL
jgi:hypothetical protein